QCEIGAATPSRNSRKSEGSEGRTEPGAEVVNWVWGRERGATWELPSQKPLAPVLGGERLSRRERAGCLRLIGPTRGVAGERGALETACFAPSGGTWNTLPGGARRRTWTVPLGLQTAR